MQRWDYGFLTITTKAIAPTSNATQWRWHRTAHLSVRATTAAKWTLETEAGDEPGQAEWVAEPKNVPPYQQNSFGPVDLLGDLGWELVSVVVMSSSVVQGNAESIGYVAPTSSPHSTMFSFKRPKG